MKQQVIEVLMVEPGREPRIVRLDNSLESLQAAVSIGAEYRGLIEIISLSDEVCILCNEEGKLIGLEPNRRLWSDVLCGVFYVTGQDNEGNLCSLSAKDMEHYKELFAIPESITQDEADNALFAGFYIV